MKNTNKKALSFDQALSKAAALCSGSEHCPFEIEEKLRKWGVGENDVEKIVCRLMDEDFINEERYCHAFCSDKFRYNHWGRIRIRQELRMRHLPSNFIKKALTEIDEQEYRQVLLNIVEQKNHLLKDEDEYTRRGKLIRHALSRGFETELVMEVLD